jgi:hypothetical protein
MLHADMQEQEVNAKQRTKLEYVVIHCFLCPSRNEEMVRTKGNKRLAKTTRLYWVFGGYVVRSDSEQKTQMMGHLSNMSPSLSSTIRTVPTVVVVSGPKR